MNKLTILLTMAALLLATSVQSANDRHPLNGHVPDAVAKLQPIGRLAATNELQLAIGLASRDEQGLDAFIQALSDPANPNYRHYLTPEQFTEKFGPTEQDYQTLIDYVKASGLNVTRQYSNRVVLDVSGVVADIEQAFQVTMLTYQHPDEARAFYAPNVEPSLPLGVSALHIAGLDNYALPHPKHRQHPPDQGGISPKAGSAPGGQLWGNDFRDAYVPGSTLTGAGQNVGLLEFDAFYLKDVTNYENAIGMNPANRPQLVVVPVKGGVSKPSSSGNTEVAGDIEMVVSMAPGLKAVYVFETTSGSFDDLFASMVTYTNVLQFSCSWGGGTAQDPTSEVLFKQMAAQGQSFYDASGDSGAMIGNIVFPSDSPSIMQVGGTTLTNGPAPSYPWKSEVVWAWSSGPNVSARSATSSSGGVSTYYAIPSWQSNLNLTASQGSTTMRNFPDIAANADNCYLYYNNGTTAGGWGGTSFAAPLWAGYTALINQQAAANGKPPVGFLNPALYALASGPNYTNLFHDVTSGNNTWKSSPAKYFAVAGYDLCCGLGTMNGTALINALAGTGAAPPPAFLPTLLSAGKLTLSWNTVAGKSYQLQSTSDFTTTNWTNFGPAITASNSLATASDSPTNSHRFYRVLQLP